MTPTDLRQNFLPVKSVGLHYTHFRNHLPLFMRLPGPKNPKNCQILRRVAKVGLEVYTNTCHSNRSIRRTVGLYVPLLGNPYSLRTSYLPLALPRGVGCPS